MYTKQIVTTKETFDQGKKNFIQSFVMEYEIHSDTDPDTGDVKSILKIFKKNKTLSMTYKSKKGWVVGKVFSGKKWHCTQSDIEEYLPTIDPKFWNQLPYRHKVKNREQLFEYCFGKNYNQEVAQQCLGKTTFSSARENILLYLVYYINRPLYEKYIQYMKTSVYTRESYKVDRLTKTYIYYLLNTYGLNWATNTSKDKELSCFSKTVKFVKETCSLYS
jgi:hypothetical protein